MKHNLILNESYSTSITLLLLYQLLVEFQFLEFYLLRDAVTLTFTLSLNLKIQFFRGRMWLTIEETFHYMLGVQYGTFF